MVVEHFTRGARAVGHGAAQDFYAHLLALDRHLGPCAGKRRQPVNMAQHFPRRPVPIDPRLGFFDFCGVGHAFRALLGELQFAAFQRAHRPRHQVAAEPRQRIVHIGCGHRIGNRHAFGHRDIAGIKAGIHSHYHHAGLDIACHDGAVDRRGAAPVRQE